jgi:WD40 repeat protein
MTTLGMAESLGPGVVRVRDTVGEVAGAGFLIAPDIVCTCAHVVARALGSAGAESAPDPPDGRLTVDFPLLGGVTGPAPASGADVIAWRPAGHETGDIALLRLAASGAVPGPGRPVPLAGGTEVWDHRFRVLGFPHRRDQGLWAAGRLRAPVGAGWVAMDEDGAGGRITYGYSGSPVWDVELGGVVGMTVAAERGLPVSTAYMIPAATLLGMRPGLRHCPYRGLEPFGEDDAEFFHGREDDTGCLVDAVLQYPVVTVVGPSGSGKSSLVLAGALPALRDKGFTVTRFRPIPGTDPARELRRALLGDDTTPAGGGDAGEPLGERLLRRSGPAGHVLFLDQLEEVVASAPEEARALLGHAVELTRTPHPADRRKLHVLATLRPESLEGLIEPSTVRLLSEGTQLLAPLDREDMLRAVTASAVRVPGLAFEPGLPERIVDDAGHEPGSLPLVEFVLTRLWEECGGLLLTHDAYEALGGVGGALSAYAEDSVRRIAADAGEDAVRRVFTQLARPVDTTTFARIPARLDALSPELRRVAESLSRTRLVVLNEQIVDLAHEALIRQWPRLREWLEESREFRLWQERLRGSMAEWHDGGRDAGILLRGARLERAKEWLATRSADISDDERRYVELSRRHQRRGVRRWQGATAVIAVLALVAGLLTVYAANKNGDLRGQLRAQASSVLGERSETLADTAPSSAVQLAEAAWHNGRTPQAYQALLDQYVATQDTVRMYRGLWTGDAKKLLATPDAQTIAVKADTGSGRTMVTVYTGLLTGRPAPWVVPGVPPKADAFALSDDGSLLAAAAPDGRVTEWNVTARSTGKVLPGAAAPKGAKTRSLDFTSKGDRLLQLNVLTGRSSQVRVRVWDLPSGKQVQADQNAAPSDPAAAGIAALTDDGSAIVIIPEDPAAPGGATVDVRALNDGKQLRTVKGVTAFVRGGSALLTQNSDGTRGRLISTVTGRPIGSWFSLSALTSGDYTAGFSDASGSYGLAIESATAQTPYVKVDLLEYANNQRFATALPLAPVRSLASTVVSAAPGPHGTLATLFAVGDDLWLVHAQGNVHGPTDPTPSEGGGIDGVQRSPNGRYTVGWFAAGSGLDLRLTETGRPWEHKAHWNPPAGDNGSPEAVFTADSRHVLLWLHRGGVQAYSVPGLAPERSVFSSGVTALTALGGSRIALLTGGSLWRFDAGTRLLTKVTETACDAAGCTFLVGRPGHPDQIAAVTKDGWVVLWDLSQRRTVRQWRLDPPPNAESVDWPMAFSPEGSRLTAVTADGLAHVWDLEDSAQQTVRLKSLSSVMTVTPDGILLTHSDDGSGPESVSFWDIASGREFASMPITADGTVLRVQSVSDKGITLSTDLGYLTIPFPAQVWFTRLCALQNRPFTAEEKSLLPDGADRSMPCRGVPVQH